ncbi:MAG: glycoside hydrolase family 43 protein [Prevotella sp.]|nr:glycoside hydrolase family 43 protein [Prevotella sp.]
MKQILTLLFAFISLLTVQAQQLRNPVIPGFHPDPSVCRVGSDYYLVNSSFQYFPGVPIFHSKDLVSWKQIGNVLDRESQLPLSGATSWLGIYAPTIRYHEGTYYMITTNVGKQGNFLVTASNPAGPWSEPLWLEQGGIDPSLFFEDGKTYMVSNPDNTITLCEIDPTTGKRLTDSKPLWQGTGGRWPEGPHIYKKDGWYYLLISEGGTELAHRLTIARSRNIYGPYEANPANPLLTNCSMAGQTMQIQGTGHGDFVQAHDGSWWLVFLAYRNYGGSYHHLGRETCLAPVEWGEGAWPVVNGGQPIDTLMTVPSLLNAAAVAPVVEEKTDFRQPLGPGWLYIQNPVKANYRQHDGRLTLTASDGTLTDNEQPTFVGRRQQHARFIAETEISAVAGTGGLTVYQINDGHADFCLSEQGEIAVTLRLKSVAADIYRMPIRLTSDRRVVMRVESDGEKYYFSYRFANDSRSHAAGSIECSLLSTEVAGGFTGVVLGMYADSGRLTFDRFEYKENPLYRLSSQTSAQ